MNAFGYFLIIQSVIVIGLSLCLLLLTRTNKKKYVYARLLELKGLLDYGTEMKWHEESEVHCRRLVERYINVFGKDKDFLFMFYSAMNADPRPLFDKKNVVTIHIGPEDIKITATEKATEDAPRIEICG